VRLRKLDSNYDPTDRINAIVSSPDAEDLHAHLNTYEMAFNKLGEKDLCPGAGMLERINAALP
jgi:2-oxoglutarate ferredoxin oxidoreductase subunit beta